MRLPPAEPNGYYHVYNRGVDKRKVFLRHGHYLRFVKTMRNILTTGSATERPAANQHPTLISKSDVVPDVILICYSLMPNHYHLLLKQLTADGISRFMQKLNNSYTKYLNADRHRTGHLFEQRYKAKQIESDNMLLHVSRYIHLNPLIAGLVDNLRTYEWSSYPDYIGIRNGTLCQKDEILDFFQNDPTKYKAFVNDQIEYALLLDKIKRAQETDEGEDVLFL